MVATSEDCRTVAAGAVDAGSTKGAAAPIYVSDNSCGKAVSHEDSTKGSTGDNGHAMFVDAAAMKAKLRQQMAKPDYNVANFYHKTGTAQAVARNPYFEKLTLFVIGFNALWIWIDTDYNTSPMLSEADWPFQVAEHAFCVYFTSEWLVRFLAFRRKRDCVRDAWFVFDGFMVIMMVLETWVMQLVLVLMGGGGSGEMGNMALARILRLLRLTRMARMARLLRAMPELMILIKGMMAAARSVVFTLLLLCLMLYVFGIAFTQVSEGTAVGEEHFGTVPDAMHTLLLRGTLMDELAEIVEQLGDGGAHLPVMFYIFILLSALTVMNMLIGVLCEVVSAVAATEREESSVAYVKWKLKDIMRKGGLDTDGNGMISKEEFCKILENRTATRTLHEAGVDVFGLVDCADFIFQSEMVSEEEEALGVVVEKQLNFADFMEVVLQLRGSNSVTVKDIVDLRKFISICTKQLEKKIASVEENISARSGKQTVAKRTIIEGEKSFGSDIPLQILTLERKVDTLMERCSAMGSVWQLADPAPSCRQVFDSSLPTDTPCGGGDSSKHFTFASLGPAWCTGAARMEAQTKPWQAQKGLQQECQDISVFGLAAVNSELSLLRHRLDAELAHIMSHVNRVSGQGVVGSWVHEADEASRHATTSKVRGNCKPDDCPGTLSLPTSLAEPGPTMTPGAELSLVALAQEL